jgi:chromosome segregation ATPase
MREPESESTPDVKPSERDRARLEEDLVEAKEQLRLAGEETLSVRRDLDQFIEVLIDVETYARGLEDQLDECLARLREAQGSRRANLIKLDEAVELLNLRNAELETSLAEAEASQFRCSQVSFLSAALQERVTELEAEIKKLKSTQKYSAIPAANTDSRLSRPTDTGKRARRLAFIILYAHCSSIIRS